MIPAGLEWRVEETCRKAWPALRQTTLDGWVLRFSEGLTRRANSANPLGAHYTNIDGLIARSEALYQRQGLPTIFRLPSLLDDAVDRRLASLGYGRDGESCVLYGDIGAVEAVADSEVRLLPHPTSEWFSAMAVLQRQSVKEAEIYRRVVDQITIPAAFAELMIDKEIVALALGAIHGEILCYESVITDVRHMRRGYARRIISSLAAWAKDQRAQGACLEVEAGNAPARALYDAVGLKKELYQYHYRRESGRRSPL
jgi:ribosomal protein S18 acetylase RimI-like enzyme